jgi:hypothetical protein
VVKEALELHRSLGHVFLCELFLLLPLFEIGHQNVGIHHSQVLVHVIEILVPSCNDGLYFSTNSDIELQKGITLQEMFFFDSLRIIDHCGTFLTREHSLSLHL